MRDAVAIPITHIERKPNSQHYRVIGKGVTVAFLSRLIDAVEWPVTRICAEYNLTQPKFMQRGHSTMTIKPRLMLS